jgi:hypothetical protein
MSTSSGICKTRACKIGQGDPLAAIEAAAEAFERELDEGVYTVNSLPSLSGISSETAVQRIETPVQRQIRLFGEVDFYTAVASLNAYFEREEIKPLIKDYPLVSERIQGPPLSPIEIAGFMDVYQYTPRSISFQSGILNDKLISELENFYKQNISSGVIGSFCALMPNVFGAIDSFFTALSNIQGFIDQVKDFASNLQGNLKNLLENLKTQLMTVIDQVVSNVKNIIENFTIDNVIKEVKTFIEDRIFARFFELKESAMRFFEDLSIENIKARVKAIIDSVSDLFKNPTLEDIQYLIYRFCNFASSIEETFNDLLNPLKDLKESLESAIDIVNGRSLTNTQRAIAAGGIRLTPAEIEARRRRAEAIERAAEERRRSEVGASPVSRRVVLTNNRPLTAEDRKNATQWNDGRGDSKVTFSDGMRADPYVVGRTVIGPASVRWTNVNIDVRALLMRVQSRFGRKLTIVSGWRDPRQQAQLFRDFQAGRVRGPVARPGNSLHEVGLALDIQWQGMNRQSILDFITIAAEEGFRTFGDYGSFVHIDTSGSAPRAYTARTVTRQDLERIGVRPPRR